MIMCDYAISAIIIRPGNAIFHAPREKNFEPAESANYIQVKTGIFSTSLV